MNCCRVLSFLILIISLNYIRISYTDDTDVDSYEKTLHTNKKNNENPQTLSQTTTLLFGGAQGQAPTFLSPFPTLGATKNAQPPYVRAIPIMQIGLPTLQLVPTQPPFQAPLTLTIPPLESCRLGQRFIFNHVLFICHQYKTDFHGFRPFACAVKNQLDAKFIQKGSTYNSEHFRYKCLENGNALIYKALYCLLNEIQIRPGESLRRGQTEYTCLMDKEGMIKLIEKTLLHDFCLPGNQNESLLEQGRCPGVTVRAIFADFGSGSEVIFDSKRLVIVGKERILEQTEELSEAAEPKEKQKTQFNSHVFAGFSPTQKLQSMSKASVGIKNGAQKVIEIEEKIVEGHGDDGEEDDAEEEDNNQTASISTTMKPKCKKSKSISTKNITSSIQVDNQSNPLQAQTPVN